MFLVRLLTFEEEDYCKFFFTKFNVFFFLDLNFLFAEAMLQLRES